MDQIQHSFNKKKLFSWVSGGIEADKSFPVCPSSALQGFFTFGCGGFQVE